MTSSSSASQPQNAPDAWESVWLRILHMDPNRVVERGQGRKRIERIGNDTARTAMGAEYADDPAAQQLIMQMSLALPYLPLDRTGFVLAAAAALGRQSDVPDLVGEALARLHEKLMQLNIRAVESSFAAAQRDLEHEAEATAQATYVDLQERYRLLVRALGDLSRSGNQDYDLKIDGEEATYLNNIAARLSRHDDRSEELARARQKLHEAEQANHHLAEKLKRFQKPLVTRRRPNRTLLTSWQDTERHAARWMQYLGYVDAVVTAPGPDGGVDVISERAIAQVKAEGHLTGSAVIRQLAGLTVGGKHRRKKCLVFSTFGYSRDAVAAAEEIGVALFRFADGGVAVAENPEARKLLEIAARTEASIF